jgi:hypothetical protein
MSRLRRERSRSRGEQSGQFFLGEKKMSEQNGTSEPVLQVLLSADGRGTKIAITKSMTTLSLIGLLTMALKHFSEGGMATVVMPEMEFPIPDKTPIFGTQADVDAELARARMRDELVKKD